MIKVIREGAGWSVTRDGYIVKETIEGVETGGIHATKGSAYRYALRVKTPGEKIEVEGGIDDIDPDESN